MTRKLFLSVFTVLAAAPIQINDTGIAAIAANPTGFYIVWSRQNKDYRVVVAGSRLNAAGAKLDGTNGVSISGTKAPHAYDPIAATWDGVNWRATWGDYTNLWVARINSSGTVLDAGSVKVPGPRPGLSAGNGTGGIQLVWTTYTNSNTTFTPPPWPRTTRPASTAASRPVPSKNQADIADGSIASYSWSFGDGGTSALASPNCTYVNRGTFLARLTVTISVCRQPRLTNTRSTIPGTLSFNI